MTPKPLPHIRLMILKDLIDNKLPPRAIILMTVLMDHHKDYHPSILQLQKQTGYTRSTVFRSLKTLVDHNIILKAGYNTYGVTIYKIHPHRLSKWEPNLVGLNDILKVDLEVLKNK